MQLLITHARFLSTALLSSDSEALILYKCHYFIHYFLETFDKNNKLVLYWIILKCNTSRFGSAIQVLPSDFGEYLSSFFNPVDVVLIFILFYNGKMFLHRPDEIWGIASKIFMWFD